MPVIPKTKVQKWTEEEPSVVESPIERGLRTAARWLGVGDPAGEVMGAVGGVIETPGNAPLKELARQARAKSQGFVHDLFHGSGNPNIEEFYSPITTNSRYDYGIHATPEPHTAAVAAMGLPPFTTGPVQSFERGLNIMPLKVRMDKTLEMPDVSRWSSPSSWYTRLTEPGTTKLRSGIQTSDPEFLREIVNEARRPMYKGAADGPRIKWQENLTEKLKDAGYDSIKYPNKFEGQGEPSYLLTDPRKIRSKFAEFDPKNIGKKGLLGSMAAPIAALSQLKDEK